MKKFELAGMEQFTDLTMGEMMQVEGGSWGQFFEGLAIAGGVALAIACAPVAVPTYVIVFAGITGMAYAGYTVGTAW